MVRTAATALAARPAWPLGPCAAFMAERAAAVIPAVVLFCAPAATARSTASVAWTCVGSPSVAASICSTATGSAPPATAIATMALTSDWTGGHITFGSSSCENGRGVGASASQAGAGAARSGVAGGG